MAVTTAGSPLKKMTHNGQPVKKWVHDGVPVWNSAVTLVNLIGSAAASHTSAWGDIGHDSFNVTVKSITTVPGHRYYVRAAATSWASPYDSNPYDGYCNAEFIANVAVRNGTDHAIVTATGTSHACRMTGQRYNSSQGSATATFYMVVDLTELESETGKTYTADSFWAMIGNNVFYNSKEFEV